MVPVKKTLILMMCFLLITALTGCSSGSGGHGSEPAGEAETHDGSAGQGESAGPAGTVGHGETAAPQQTVNESGDHTETATAESQESKEAHLGSGETEESAEPQHTATPTPAPTPTATPAPTPTPKGAVKDGWVLSIPDLVPRFEYGELDLEGSKITEASISTLYHLKFVGVQKADVDSYCKVLREAGYHAAAAEIGSTYTLTASKDLGWNSVAMVITLTENDGVAVFALDAPV